jgi:hypothetical protein
MKPENKVRKVMREFKSGELKSSSGKKVTNPKQAIAIGLSEASMSKPKKESEMKYAKGGMAASKMGKVATAKPKMGSASSRADGVAHKGKTKGKQVVMAGGKGMKKGGKC